MPSNETSLADKMKAPLSADPTRILVAGDWHGNTGWALDIVRSLPSMGVSLVLQLGDFGVWPGPPGDSFLRKLTTALEQAPAELWFIDGNHEKHPRLDALTRDYTGRAPLTSRISHLPRGHRWVWHGRTWLALGGAVSLDRAARTEGKDWWPGEEITPGQVRHAIHDGPADVMVTHDCPAGVRHTFPTPPSWWAQEDLDRSDAHRDRLQHVVDAVQPSHLLHGHLHRAYARTVSMRRGRVEVVGLDCDGAAYGNWGILNVETMKWDQIHGP